MQSSKSAVLAAAVREEGFVEATEQYLLGDSCEDESNTAVSHWHSKDQLVRECAILRSELALARSALRLWDAAFEQSAVGIILCDRDTRIIRVNAAFEQLTGCTRRELLGSTPQMLHSGVTIKAIHDQPGNITHYLGVVSDLAGRKTAATRPRQPDYDPLTELPNRTLLVHRLMQLIEAARLSREKLAVLYIDLDRFNDINDSMGHQAGDLLLQTIAERLCATVRRTDTVARLSADEFVVLLPTVVDGADAEGICKKILANIRAPVNLHGQQVVISAGVGISLYPENGTDAEELILNAAAAMSRIKRERRDAYRFYTRELNDRAANRLQTQNALRLALERNEFVLHFQPQIALQQQDIVGAEALIRWNRPGEGLLMPSQFIQIAEECGLILGLGNWLLAEAARQIRAWDALGVPDIRLAINISPSQFRQPDFAERVAQEISANGIEPARLELELTEEIAVRDIEATMQTLRRLHQLGVGLSLDDFGTGYSSLSYLRHFPIDKIKIDQSFVHELTNDEDSVRIVRAIIALARAFRLKVIAEGVETPQQLAALRNQHCDEIQGYLASPPLAAEEFVRFMRGWKKLP